MSEIQEWLSAMGIAGIERLSGVFEAEGFSSRKSLQYLEEADLDYMFSSPKKLRLAEKRAITQELRQLKLKFGDNEINQETLPISTPTVTPPSTVDSPLERRKMELVENVSVLEAQVASAQEHLSQLRRENDSLETVTRGRVCGNCHQSGHNKNRCRGLKCDSHMKCRMKDKHPEVAKSIGEAQKMVATLKKNSETAKQTLEQFMLQMQKSRGSFFAVMRPRLKRLNPIRYLKRQDLDKDLMYLQRVLGNKIPPESDDWRLPYMIECSQRGVLGTVVCTPPATPAPRSGQVNLQANQVHVVASGGGAVQVGPSTSVGVPDHGHRFHPYY